MAYKIPNIFTEIQCQSQNLLTHIEGKNRHKLKSFLKLWFLNQLPENFHSHLHGRFTASSTPDLHHWVHSEVQTPWAAALMICDLLCIQEPKVLEFGLQQKRTLGSPDLFKGHSDEPPLLLGSKRAKKRSRREKWTDRNTKTSQINPPERPNLLKLSNMNRQELWDPWEDGQSYQISLSISSSQASCSWGSPAKQKLSRTVLHWILAILQLTVNLFNI